MCYVESCYETTCEDTADWEESVPVVMNSRVCEVATALGSLEVMIYKITLYPITNISLSIYEYKYLREV
jgi:hypothetical protein